MLLAHSYSANTHAVDVFLYSPCFSFFSFFFCPALQKNPEIFAATHSAPWFSKHRCAIFPTWHQLCPIDSFIPDVRSHPAMMSPDLDSLWPPKSFWVPRWHFCAFVSTPSNSSTRRLPSGVLVPLSGTTPSLVLRCLRPRWLRSLALSGSSHRWPLPGCSALPWIPATLLSLF